MSTIAITQELIKQKEQEITANPYNGSLPIDLYELEYALEMAYQQEGQEQPFNKPAMVRNGELVFHPALDHLDFDELLDYTDEQLQALVDAWEANTLELAAAQS